MPNPAPCNYTLAAGRRCAQPRLRGELLCRHHRRNRAFAEQEQSLDRLWSQLEAMDLPQVLETLLEKLDGIHCTLRAYPEAKLTLIFTVNRLAELTSIESRTSPQPQQNQSPAFNPNNLQDLLESLMESMNYSLAKA